MYQNIGGKIKGLAIATAVIGAIVSVIMALVFFDRAGKLDYYYEELKSAATITGMLWLFIGPLVSWLGSLALYGFGELIDTAKEIEYNTRKDDYSLPGFFEQDCAPVGNVPPVQEINVPSKPQIENYYAGNINAAAYNQSVAGVRNSKEEIENLYSKGLITLEEYNQMILNLNRGVNNV